MVKTKALHGLVVFILIALTYAISLPSEYNIGFYLLFGAEGGGHSERPFDHSHFNSSSQQDKEPKLESCLLPRLFQLFLKEHSGGSV